ncbi:MAG: baseplate J/gp47 family protein [Candidatus Paraimprobicoccus trichonymphae]|uniref:Baseplate J/gp47 family protein n=1 Tax=Candidatus Paraimprobicoccus trichonymphae TaxID=3033793 RepID=A0AA48HWJ7_9FIRM|nr:MAG: baseplate J/gp47 family protein [Candidatus Paraimprobicoccus trichonymphae]
MLKLENFNDQSLEDILEESKNQVSYLNNDWTNLQESDPGITILELFAWLKYVQHEYLNRISPNVKLKFLNLLNINLIRNKGSNSLIGISGIKNNCTLPKSTKFEAENMIFENNKPKNLINSKILSLGFYNPEFSIEEKYENLDNTRYFYIFGKEFKKVDKYKSRSFFICFDKKFLNSTKIKLYFYILENSRRNKIKDDDYFEELVKVKWEYYGLENDKLGWHEINIIKDLTHNFLFSNMVSFKINGEMKTLDNLYKIKISLMENNYDYPPKIRNVFTNIFKVEQKSTQVDNLIIKKKDLVNFNIEIYNYLFLYGKFKVFIKKLNGWIEIKTFIFERNVILEKLVIKISNIENILKKYSSEDEVFLILGYDKKFENKIILGNGTGTSNQFVEFKYENVLYDSLELLVAEEKEDKLVFSKWTRVDDFFSSDKYARNFVFNEEQKVISFGDNFYGQSPKKSTNNIILSELIFCEGAKSNIQRNKINRMITENNEFKNCKISQIIPAICGIDNETIGEAEVRMSSSIEKCTRAVNIEDYENIVKNTPGMIFENIRILPNYNINGGDSPKQNCVAIAVKINDSIGSELPKSYKNNIKKQIDKYRLINTRIYIIGPEYIGLIISGNVVVKSYYKQNENLIYKFISDFVNKINSKLGQTFHFGDLFGELDRLKYVEYLEDLKIIPTGNYLSKTASEDIIIPPNGTYYLKKINLNYIKSSDIYRD